MRVCDLQTGMGRLHLAANELKDCWIDTRQQWGDRTCQQFEEQFLQQLGPLLNQTIAAVRKFAEVMEQAEQECSDPDKANDFF